MEYAGTPTALNYLQKCTTHLHFYPLVRSFTAFPLRGGRCWAGDQRRTSHELEKSSSENSCLTWGNLATKYAKQLLLYRTGALHMLRRWRFHGTLNNHHKVCAEVHPQSSCLGIFPSRPFGPTMDCTTSAKWLWFRWASFPHGNDF